MHTNNRNRLVGILAILAVITSAIATENRHQPPTLLNRAHKVVALNDWNQRQANYFWLSNQKILFVTHADDESSAATFQVQCFNPQTGVFIRDVKLETALDKISGDIVIPKWQLSPDSQWLLAAGSIHNISVVWIATAVDGSKQIVRPRQQDYEGGGLYTVWQPGSKSWVQILEQADKVHACSYSLKSAVITTHIENTNLNGNVAIGFYSPDRLLCMRPQTGDGGGIGVMDLGTEAVSTPVRNYLVNIPPNMDVQEIIMSPDRTRLAWKAAVKSLPLGLKSTLNSDYVRHSKPAVSGLWVSDLNGNHLREIGTIDIRDDSISNIRWTPDGTCLSFIDAGDLYTVPIN